jgi:hypothetical protein
MSDEEFKTWLNNKFSEAPHAPNDEFLKLNARIRREAKEASQIDRKGLFFCVASIALTVLVIAFAKTPVTVTTVTNPDENEVLSADAELDREFDVSLDHLNKILNSSRQM